MRPALLAILILGSTSVASAQVRKEPTLPEGVKRLTNLTYAERSKGNLALDLYLPTAKATSPLPVILWVHGGGWSAGSKDRCPGIWLAAEGYAVASIQYRLTGVAQWPAQIDDCRDAIRWLRAHAKDYGLDSSHIGVWGSSAGGHLVALLGTLDAPPQESLSTRVQAVCDWCGPSDLLTMPPNVPGPDKTDADLAKANGAKLLGGIVKNLPEKARAASALYHVSKDDPPFLIMHGDKDASVPLEQSERLAQKLKDAGVPVTLEVLRGAGHGGKDFYTPEARKRVKDFFDQWLKVRS